MASSSWHATKRLAETRLPIHRLLLMGDKDTIDTIDTLQAKINAYLSAVYCPSLFPGISTYHSFIAGLITPCGDEGYTIGKGYKAMQKYQDYPSFSLHATETNTTLKLIVIHVALASAPTQIREIQNTIANLILEKIDYKEQSLHYNLKDKDIVEYYFVFYQQYLWIHTSRVVIGSDGDLRMKVNFRPVAPKELLALMQAEPAQTDSTLSASPKVSTVPASLFQDGHALPESRITVPEQAESNPCDETDASPMIKKQRTI